MVTMFQEKKVKDKCFGLPTYNESIPYKAEYFQKTGNEISDSGLADCHSCYWRELWETL